MDKTPDNAGEVPLFSPFDPAKFQFDWERISGRELEWEPGRRIRIHRPPPTLGGMITLCLIMTVLVGLMAGLFVGVMIDSRWMPMAVLGALGVGLITALIYARLYREKEVVFDWATREARFRDGSRRRTYRFDEIRAVHVKERRRNRSSGGGGSHHSTKQRVYGMEVLIETSDCLEQVALSDFHVASAIPLSRTAPLAMELARALDLPAPELPKPRGRSLEWIHKTKDIRARIDEAQG